MADAPEIHHLRTGSGEPLVLLHGIGQFGAVWQPVIDVLGDGLETFACDTPGFGASPPLPSGPTSIPACADAFAAFFAEAGLDRPHVAGNSMGGAIALELARRGVVRSATAFSPAGFWNRPELGWTRLVLGVLGGVPGPLQPGVKRVMGTSVPKAAVGGIFFRWPSRLTAQEYGANLQGVWDAPAFDDALAAFDGYAFSGGDELRGTPVTVAWGRYDRLLPFRPQAGRARQALPWAHHVVLGTGHLPYHDDPAAVAATLRASTRRA